MEATGWWWRQAGFDLRSAPRTLQDISCDLLGKLIAAHLLWTRRGDQWQPPYGSLQDLKIRLPQRLFREDLAKSVWRRLDRTGAVDRSRSRHWFFFRCSPGGSISGPLILDQFLSADHWSGKVFDMLSRSSSSQILELDGDSDLSDLFPSLCNGLAPESIDLSGVKELVLGTTWRHPDRRDCLLYEVDEAGWKARLQTLLVRLTGLERVTLNNGFYDDDVLCLLGSVSNPRTLRISCEAFEVADAQRLTDDGIVDFLEALLERNGPDSVKLECLDLGDCCYRGVTSKSLAQLGRLPNLKELCIRSEHLVFSSLYEDNLPDDSDRPKVKTVRLSVGILSAFEAGLRDRILEGLQHGLTNKFFPMLETLELSEMAEEGSELERFILPILGRSAGLVRSCQFIDSSSYTADLCAQALPTLGSLTLSNFGYVRTIASPPGSLLSVEFVALTELSISDEDHPIHCTLSEEVDLMSVLLRCPNLRTCHLNVGRIQGLSDSTADKIVAVESARRNLGSLILRSRCGFSPQICPVAAFKLISRCKRLGRVAGLESWWQGQPISSSVPAIDPPHPTGHRGCTISSCQLETVKISLVPLACKCQRECFSEEGMISEILRS